MIVAGISFLMILSKMVGGSTASARLHVPTRAQRNGCCGHVKKANTATAHAPTVHLPSPLTAPQPWQRPPLTPLRAAAAEPVLVAQGPLQAARVAGQQMHYAVRPHCSGERRPA